MGIGKSKRLFLIKVKTKNMGPIKIMIISKSTKIIKEAYLDYATPYMKYTEEIIALSAEELVMLNAQKTEYHYKKATAINILSDGKKTK